MSSYWYQPARFNPMLGYQQQSLLDMLMRTQMRTGLVPPLRPSWQTPAQVSPALLLRGLGQPGGAAQSWPQVRFEPPSPLGGVGPLPPTPGTRPTRLTDFLTTQPVMRGGPLSLATTWAQPRTGPRL